MAKRAIARIGRMAPTVIGCYTLHETGLTVRGRPSFGEHQGAGEFIQRAYTASGWWMADWLRYGETRTDWKDRLQQIVGATGLSEKRVKNIRAVGAIPQSRRRDAVEFSLHEEVAGLPDDEQVHFLELAETEGLDRRELRHEIRAARRRRIVEGQAILEGMYRVFSVDCPWDYDDDGPTEDGSLGKAARHYGGMSIEDLCKMPVAAHALPNAVMGFWVTVPMLYDSPGPRDVIEAWGFTYKTHRVWDKVLGNPGSYGLQVKHELFMICTRGSCLPDVPLPHDDSVFVQRRSPKHSEKPAEGRDYLKRHWTTGPYLELFATERAEGWDAFGNDANLWATESHDQRRLG